MNTQWLSDVGRQQKAKHETLHTLHVELCIQYLHRSNSCDWWHCLQVPTGKLGEDEQSPVEVHLPATAAALLDSLMIVLPEEKLKNLLLRMRREEKKLLLFAVVPWGSAPRTMLHQSSGTLVRRACRWRPDVEKPLCFFRVLPRYLPMLSVLY
jgi:hypothetical protein